MKIFFSEYWLVILFVLTILSVFVLREIPWVKREREFIRTCTIATGNLQWCIDHVEEAQ